MTVRGKVSPQLSAASSILVVRVSAGGEVSLGHLLGRDVELHSSELSKFAFSWFD